MRKDHFKKKEFILLTLILSVFSLYFTPQLPAAGNKRIKGVVFFDLNKNGKFEKGEPGIGNVAVSNQQEVVVTDNNGRFYLPLRESTIIFVSKPVGYQVPLDENNIPRFYYIHQPTGSPKGLKYTGIAPTKKPPRTLYFPLVKEKDSDSFDAIIMGDPQTRTPNELDYYRDNVIAGLVDTDAQLYLALGDILYDELHFYDRMNNVVGQMGIPVYHVMGNHDMNHRAENSDFEAETFKNTYGPDYYSFNYGKVHFVVLNSIKHKGWDKEKNKSNGYIGHLHQRQLTWLKNDLAFVPEDHLVVLSMHIPIYTPGEQAAPSVVIDSRPELFKILENRKHLLALAGHMHYIEYLEFDKSHGWQSRTVFPQLIAGAGCGTWWHGVKDPRGIPFGIGTDGSPNGYFRFSFDGNNYSYQFHPTRSLDHTQMRINSPFGKIKKVDLDKQSINVNVFAGTEQTIVKYRLDHHAAVSLKQTMMKDPLFEEILKNNPGVFLDWMEPTPTNHIWTTPLPTNLSTGVHRLKIMVRDYQGNVYEAYRLFEVSD